MPTSTIPKRRKRTERCNPDASVDCDRGRELGCETFCCRLLVRLKPHEMEPTTDGSAPKGFVDKNEDGTCVHFDPITHKCLIWDARPETCRDFTCNNHPLLQVVLEQGFTSLVQIVTAKTDTPPEDWTKIPTTSD